MMKTYEIKIFKLVRSDTDEYATELDARKFGAALRDKLKQQDPFSIAEYMFEIDELESDDE